MATGRNIASRYCSSNGIIVTSEATFRKRTQLLEFIDQKLVRQAAVEAVVVVGSVATGRARPDSDIDAFVFMSPLDPYIVPAESIWRQRDNTYHSIFSGDQSLDPDGVQLDFHRVDLGRWRDPGIIWPEAIRAELADGWIAFDRNRDLERLVAERTAVPEAERQRAMDEVVVWVDALIQHEDLAERWKTLGPVDAADRLQAAYEYLVQGLFAYNRKWRPWRTREMTALQRLQWLPEGFDRWIMAAAVSSGHDLAAYSARTDALQHAFAELLVRMQADGTYGDDPVSEAFVRSHDEPGRAWNIDAWNIEHHRRADRTSTAH